MQQFRCLSPSLFFCQIAPQEGISIYLRGRSNTAFQDYMSASWRRDHCTRGGTVPFFLRCNATLWFYQTEEEGGEGGSRNNGGLWLISRDCKILQPDGPFEERLATKLHGDQFAKGPGDLQTDRQAVQCRLCETVVAADERSVPLYQQNRGPIADRRLIKCDFSSKVHRSETRHCNKSGTAVEGLKLQNRSIN